MDENKTRLFTLKGTFKVDIEAEDEDEAIDKFAEMSVCELVRVDLNDIIEW